MLATMMRTAAGVLEKRYALEFDGVDDYVQVTDDNSIRFGEGDPLSLCAWIKSDSTEMGFSNAIIAKFDSTSESIALRFDDGELLVQLQDEPQDNMRRARYETDIRTGDWRHVVATFDGTTDESGLKIYIDGNEVSVVHTSTGGISWEPTSDWLIGALRASDITQHFDGFISDARIYNKELSASEVSDVYSGEGVTDGLVAYWPMNEGSGSTVYDESTNNNDGTIHGASWFYVGMHPRILDFRP